MAKVTPTKSLNDPKDYLALVLENGLKLLLVSDKDCDKAAASVSVGVGSMNDPEDLPGLAHLCEHLLSVEVNNTPGYKPFNVFIAKNGGMFNAFTGRDQTNFHFDVDPVVFTEALQRFSKFFTSEPKLTEKDVEREVSIVDSEHLSKVNKDAWRKMAVDASTAKKSHPFYKFTTGNKKTLLDVPKQKGINVLNAAKDFRSKYYVSNIVSVVVYGKDTLDDLEKHCVPLFSKVPDNKDITLSQWDDWPYGENELQQKVEIVSLADVRDFYIVFPIPNTRPFYKTFPHGYITRLLGNKGPGSLFSYLYLNQWVENVYINSSVPARGFGELSVGFQLTKEGMDHRNEITTRTFQYIQMLRHCGVQEYFWKEMQEILSLQFVYPEREVPVEFVQRTSNLMHVYPLEDILSVGYILTDYEPSIIENFMDYLDPKNCRIVTVSKTNDLVNQECHYDHWYGAKYYKMKFTEEQIKEWKACENVKYFHLPKENRFIPTSFDLKQSNIPGKKVESPLCWSPTLIEETSLSRAWFLEDKEFLSAKGVIKFEIFSPLPMVDPVTYNLNQILFLTLKNILSEEFFQASIAGSYHDIKPTMYGAEVTVSGYSHKLLLLMEKVFMKIITSQDNTLIENYFKSVKGRYATGLANFRNLPLQNVTTYFLSLLLREKRFSNEELSAALDDSTWETLMSYIKILFFRCHFEWLIHGNFTEKEAKSLVSSCMTSLTKHWNTRALLPCQMSRLREVAITPGADFVFDEVSIQSANSCSVFIQIGILNLRESVVLEIIDQIVFEPLFSQLRNREQIGYIVRSSVRRSNECQGLLIFVQGDKDPCFISERIFAALTQVEERLANMDTPEFLQHKNSVRVRKADRSKTMLALANKLWNNEIFPRRYDFERVHKEMTTIEQVTKDEVISFFKEYLSKNSKTRKVLQVHLSSESNSCSKTNSSPKTTESSRSALLSNTSTSLRGKPIKIKSSDVMDWKLKMNLCPTAVLTE